jgi:hypothetical protein
MSRGLHVRFHDPLMTGAGDGSVIFLLAGPVSAARAAVVGDNQARADNRRHFA